MPKSYLVIRGVRYQRFKCEHARFRTSRIVWAMDADAAARLGAQYAGSDIEDMEVSTAPLILDLQPMTPKQLEALETQ